MTSKIFPLGFIMLLIAGLIGPSLLKGEDVPSSVSDSLGLPETKMVSTSPQENSRVDEISKLWKSVRKSEAKKKIKEWKKEDKSNEAPWVLEAKLYVESGEYKKAIKKGNKALKLAPNSAQAYYWRGRAYEELEKYLEAVNEYKAALVVDEAFREAINALARVESRLKGPQTRLSTE